MRAHPFRPKNLDMRSARGRPVFGAMLDDAQHPVPKAGRPGASGAASCRDSAKICRSALPLRGSFSCDGLRLLGVHALCDGRSRPKDSCGRQESVSQVAAGAPAYSRGSRLFPHHGKSSFARGHLRRELPFPARPTYRKDCGLRRHPQEVLAEALRGRASRLLSGPVAHCAASSVSGQFPFFLQPAGSILPLE